VTSIRSPLAAKPGRVSTSHNLRGQVISTALSIGRRHSLRLANVNRPYGARYARAFNAWLDANGFSQMPYGTRAACCKLVNHLDEITIWRSTLSETDRAAQNHPETVMRHWRKATRPTQCPAPFAANDAPPLRHVVRSDIGKHRKAGGAIHWPQHSIRSAADAMRESRSSDLFTLARVALEAAIPDALALLDLLEPKPTITMKPAKSMPAALALAS
jgi:hypothetical protein